MTGEAALKALEAEINRVFPDSQVQLSQVRATVLVSGQVPHRREAGQILRVVGAHAGGDCHCQALDRLHCYGAEQVKLKVVIAEVNRTAALRAKVCVDLSRQTSCMDGRQAMLALNDLKRSKCARTLAEPTLVTLDGQIARFDAGGQVVFASNGSASAPVPYGVQLAFTPTVLDKDRVRLEVAASLSAHDAGSNSSSLHVNSRSFSSTVEMSEGQTLAVAGLMQTIVGASRICFPMWRSSSEEQELVILITPELVRPVTQAESP